MEAPLAVSTLDRSMFGPCTLPDTDKSGLPSQRNAAGGTVGLEGIHQRGQLAAKGGKLGPNSQITSLSQTKVVRPAPWSRF